MPISSRSILPDAPKGAARPTRKAPITRRTVKVLLVPPMTRATLLDLEANIALSWGHHLQAERLAHAAAVLRGDQ